LSPNASPNTSMNAHKKTSPRGGTVTSDEDMRSPMLTPGTTHKDYNRLKYYSALRTGYSHLGIEEP